MSAIPTLHARLDSADAVLRSITRLERAYRKNQRSSPAEFSSIAAIRAGVYVMVYNAVENAVRESFAGLRTAIRDEKVPFGRAQDFWQLDFVRAAFLERMQNGTNHGNVLADLIPAANAHLTWQSDRLTELPVAGNFGQGAALHLRQRLPLNWTAPANSGGGADLEIVRISRNDLAHGFEAYEDVGKLTTTPRMYEIVSRTRIYMASLVAAIEQYGAAQCYLRP